VGGALAISELMPPQYKHALEGPSLKVDPHTGAVAEGLLTFALTFALLWVVLKGPPNPIIKTLMLSITTVGLVLTGAGYTGPSMNPANVSCPSISQPCYYYCYYYCCIRHCLSPSPPND
jgi:aquaporin SIP